MFKKKDLVNKADDGIPARFVKKDGIMREDHYYKRLPFESASNDYYRNIKDKKLIPAKDISESYLSKRNVNLPPMAPNSSKGSRRIFAPSFLLRRKKNQATNKNYENIDEYDEEDLTDIASYEDLVAEQRGINPVMLGQLDDSQINTIELDQYDKFYRDRLDFVINNYRRPPPYPGHNSVKDKRTSTKAKPNNVDTPLMRQLLNDKGLNDNASMVNLLQASPNRGNHSGKQPSFESSNIQITDKLVNRTQDIVAKAINSENRMNILNAGELYEKRKQYYMNNFIGSNDRKEKDNLTPNQRDAISEIIYPEKDYDVDNAERARGISASASVPNLSQQVQHVELGQRMPFRQPRARFEPGEMEALIAHYRKTSLDSFEPYGGATGESVSLYSQDSPSYVPPSPYLSAEIPEWLKVYAKASPNLDQYLKWEMFRYPELDCWQTMLKRLYKKELEQIVLSFEEYRLQLQDEFEARIKANYQGGGIIKKSEV